MIAEIDSGHGCNYGKCSFCNVTKIYPQYVQRKCTEVAEEVNESYREGLSPVLKCQSHTPDWLLEFASSKAVMWSAFARVDTINKINGNLHRLKTGGAHCLMVGIEYLSDSVLRRMNKGTTVGDCFKAVKSAVSAGINLRLFIMTGFPQTTDAEKLEHLYNLELLLQEGNFSSRISTTCSPFVDTEREIDSDQYRKLRLGWP